MNLRETAWRIFAMEFNQSKHEFKAKDEYSPSYILSPLGAQINRLFLVGVLTDVQNVGSETQPIWRAKIADPTGVFYVSAGKFQPKLAQVLSGIEPMSFVAVVGKARTYSPQEGTVYVSIRPEMITRVDHRARDNWIIEAAGSLKRRLDYYREAHLLHPPEEEKLLSLGVPEYMVEGLIQALEVYNNGPTWERFRNNLLQVLTDFLQNPGFADPALTSEEEEDPLAEEKERALEQVMMLIANLSKESVRVRIDEVKSQGQGMKIEVEQIEDALATLLEKGNIYEPELGYIQMV